MKIDLTHWRDELSPTKFSLTPILPINGHIPADRHRNDLLVAVQLREIPIGHRCEALAGRFLGKPDQPPFELGVTDGVPIISTNIYSKGEQGRIPLFRSKGADVFPCRQAPLLRKRLHDAFHEIDEGFDIAQRRVCASLGQAIKLAKRLQLQISRLRRIKQPFRQS